jgi:hypothetical protein
MSQPRVSVRETALNEAEDETLGEPVAPRTYECDHCGRSFEGTPEGSGLFIWTRGDEVRYEEPPLCEECAKKLAIGAFMSWDVEEEEG